MRRETLLIQEIVHGTLYRARPGGGYEDSPICIEDLVVTAGRIFLAQRIGSNVVSPVNWMAVGTAVVLPALTDTTLPGEVKRKPLAVNSAINANVYTATSTFGGFADSVTSVQITEAGLFNHVNSGQGTMYQRVTFAAVTLAASDMLAITLETNVGSS